MSLAGQALTESMSDDAVRELFVLAELVAFSGLAVREFFNPLSLGYVNRDLFTLVVQNFDDPRSGVAVETRRRDGTTRNYVRRDAYRVDRPRHVTSHYLVKLDDALLRALMEVRATDDGRYLEAIVLFNRANTDANEVRPEVELILIAGALQRLLQCGSSAHELASKFSLAFVPSEELQPQAPGRGALKQPRKPWSRSIREEWIRDLYALRGDLAHGATTPRYPSDWSLRDHLLLASYAFPRLVKICLAEQGAYTLTDRDRFDIDVFEDLARHELSQGTVHEGGEERWPWNTIRIARGWGHAVAVALSSPTQDSKE